jgi:hypothetical protein
MGPSYKRERKNRGSVSQQVLHDKDSSLLNGPERRAYCKPTLFAATLFRDSSVINWLAAINFRDRAFFIRRELHKTSGSPREMFATVWFS